VLDVRGAAVSNRLYNVLSRLAIRFQHALIGDTIVIDELMAEHVLGDADAATVIPLGADMDRFRPGQNEELRRSVGIEPDDVAFVYTGILNRARELHRLVDAFAAVERTHPRAKLVFLGDGDDRERLERRVARTDSEDTITFAGEVPFADVPAHLRAFDAGIAFVPDRRPYRIQPPLKTVEFLATGLPVVATDTPGNRRFVDADRNGLLCRDSAAAYADAIRELTDAAERKRLGSNARESVRKFDYTTIVREKLIPFYEQTLRTHR
jgi:glycosyltransferase involved in cell wall biosynthesis